jgi:hypothetical protein
MSAVDSPVRPARTKPRGADIRLLIVGAVGLFAAYAIDPEPRRVLPPLIYWVAVPIMIVALAGILAVPAFLLRGIRGDWSGFTRWIGKGLLVLTGLLLAGNVRRAMSEPPRDLLPCRRHGGAHGCVLRKQE